ncbi:MAG: SigB/SigF/SigG family RNA polymerase sigma factor [Acidimicrobiia bacterium]|nr:SigB/SigF/SigG family RNA polymerase sigma factor [Acidimicrobiia bacterium]
MTEEEALWFAQRDDPKSRRAIAENYDSLARRLAYRYRGRGEPQDDLEQVARLGLINAIERFDTEFGVQFATFATRTIMGELKRHLRDKTWSIRVPRALQELWLEVSRAAEDLTHKLGRSPTIDEIAESIGSTREAVLEALDAGSGYTSGSLDAPLTSDDGSASTLVDVLGKFDEDLERAGYWASAIDHIQALPDRERTILVMRFFEDRSQSEIADALGISQMHVSRLLRRTLTELRAEFGAPQDV